MYKIGVLGDRDSIYGFATLGLEVWPVATPEEGERALKEMAGTGYAVIYITESLYEQIQEAVEAEREHPLPAVIPIPGVKGSLSTGRARLSSFVEKAVGSDIIFNN